jgi:hypothetical protein
MCMNILLGTLTCRCCVGNNLLLICLDVSVIEIDRSAVSVDLVKRLNTVCKLRELIFLYPVAPFLGSLPFHFPFIQYQLL